MLNLKYCLEMGSSAIVSKQFKRRFIRHKARIWSPKCSYHYYEANLLSYHDLQVYTTLTKIYEKKVFRLLLFKGEQEPRREFNLIKGITF